MQSTNRRKSDAPLGSNPSQEKTATMAMAAIWSRDRCWTGSDTFAFCEKNLGKQCATRTERSLQWIKKQNRLQSIAHGTLWFPTIRRFVTYISGNFSRTIPNAASA